jgi:hypothetical protein
VNVLDWGSGQIILSSAQISASRSSTRMMSLPFFFVGAAGRSSEFGVLLLDKSFSSAKYQLSPCFHPHSRGAVGFGWMLELFGFSFGFRSSLERLPI